MTDAGARGLVAEEVTMRFGGLNALREVSVALAPGSWTGLIGPNGSGKSTLLNVLSGVYPATSGRTLLDGTDISRRTPRARARLGIVRTFQHPQLAATLTILENVQLGADLARSRRRARGGSSGGAEATLAEFGLGAYAHELPDEVPYGVRKTAEVARAVAGAPEFLLLDEPAAGLSAEERTELVAALRSLRENRPEIAVCLVEHDVGLVASVVDTVVALDAGALLVAGPTQDVLDDVRVKTAYLGVGAGAQEVG